MNHDGTAITSGTAEIPLSSHGKQIMLM